MPIHHAVLALLTDGPSYGYELKSAFEDAIGPQWGPLSIGHLYQVLDRLARDGHVHSTKVAQDVRPDRVVYEITDQGQTELSQWMSAPSPRTGGFRDDFFLKLMAAARSDDPDIIDTAIRAQRAYLLREMHNLEKLRTDQTGNPIVSLLLSAAAKHVAADLVFLDDAEKTLARDGGAILGTATKAGSPTAAEVTHETASRRRRSA